MFAERIAAAVASSVAIARLLPDETAFQVAVARSLGHADRELRAHFRPPSVVAIKPPHEAIEELARRRRPIVLPPAGKDPCAVAAKLDVLWHGGGEAVPIELKYRTEWKSDTYGYMVLKDVHRMERIRAAGDHKQLSDYRYVIFVTTQSVYWEGRRPEPRPFWLRDGMATEPGQWFQYDQPSPDTRWWRYPPFHLAASYTFRWNDLGSSGRMLLIEVRAQAVG